MKLKRIICLLFAVAIVLTAFCVPIPLPTSAEETSDYVREGLFAWYRGSDTPQSNAWQDSIGGHDLPVTVDSRNYFTEEGFHVEGSKHYFPEDILNLVNDSYYTIEIEFGDFRPIGEDYNVFMNSENDHFSLFRRVSQDVIEWKFGGGNTRPKIPDSLRYLGHRLLTFTCEYGESIVMYVNGVEMARATCDLYMGADNLFIGQTIESRSYEATYKNIRFYSRPLTAEEIAQNALAAGYDPTKAEMAPTHVTVAQPVTHIVGDVAVIRPINSQAELADMMENQVLPATAIYEINEKLEVLDADGIPFSTVVEVFEKGNYRIIPCFSFSDKETANALAAYLNEIHFSDVQLMSANREVLQFARALLPASVGILDLRAEYTHTTDLSTEQLLDIRRAIKTYSASVAILPDKLCRSEIVQYLYDRQVNVWAWGPPEPTDTEIYYALLSGAVGVVTDATDRHLEIACNRLAKNTLTRVPTNVGHRGIPSQAPENTLEGSILAYELGATVIEMDVYLSKDGHIVTMHDSSTGRTCNADLNVEASTLAELKKIYANKGFENHPTYSQCRIPALEEYMEWFKGKDCLLFIEIKSSNPAIVPTLKTLVDKYDMYDQCSVITFNRDIMAAMREDYPEMSVGALCDSSMSGIVGAVEGYLRRDAQFFGPYNGTLNPYYGGLEGEALRACLIRGISVYPWTIDGNPRTLSQYFMWGYSGLTNNHANVFRTTVKRLTLAETDTYRLHASTKLVHTVTNYDQSTEEKPVDQIIVLEGEATVRRNTLTPHAEGELTFMTLASLSCMGQVNYIMYTQPETVRVESLQAEETVVERDTENSLPPSAVTDETTSSGTPTDPPVTTPAESTTRPPQRQNGCHSALTSPILLLIPLGAMLIATRRKRKD